MMNRRRVLLLLVFAALVVLVGFDPALAQCAMCKVSVENSTDAAAASKGLSLASLVLLVPPVTIFAGLFGLIYRYRNVQGRRDLPPYES
ncbi:MAG TPA: hypothetical protein VNI02_22205 [Blastocatellia bacterium]|jgi:hypothetical protein|nr:hypothetical protein [Blastocatellia bacterium]